MSEKVFKRNRTILYKLMQKYIPNPTSEQENMFEFDIQNIPGIRKKLYSYKQLEHIYLYYLDPILSSSN